MAGGGDLLVRAVLNPAREEAALHVLSRLGVTGISVQDAIGVDEEEDGVVHRERIIVEFSVAEEISEEVLAALISEVRTGRKSNDGEIFILRPERGGD